jgi:hypothetical protein
VAGADDDAPAAPVAVPDAVPVAVPQVPAALPAGLAVSMTAFVSVKVGAVPVPCCRQPVKVTVFASLSGDELVFGGCVCATTVTPKANEAATHRPDAMRTMVRSS